MYFSPTETIFGIHGCVSRVAATVFLRRLGPEVSKRPLSEFRRRCYTIRTSTTTTTYLNPSRKYPLAGRPFQARRTRFRRGEGRAGRAGDRAAGHARVPPPWPPCQQRLARPAHLQRFADPAPALWLVAYRPHHESLGGVGQLGDDANQLTVKAIRRRRPVMRGGRHQRHDSAAARQPRRDAADVIHADAHDRISPDDVAPVVLAHPNVRRFHRCHLPAHWRASPHSGIAPVTRWARPAIGAGRPRDGAAATGGTWPPGRRRPPHRPGWTRRSGAGTGSRSRCTSRGRHGARSARVSGHPAARASRGRAVPSRPASAGGAAAGWAGAPGTRAGGNA